MVVPRRGVTRSTLQFTSVVRMRRSLVRFACQFAGLAFTSAVLVIAVGTVGSGFASTVLLTVGAAPGRREPVLSAMRWRRKHMKRRNTVCHGVKG
jgi:hypothetical protein